MGRGTASVAPVGATNTQSRHLKTGSPAGAIRRVLFDLGGAAAVTAEKRTKQVRGEFDPRTVHLFHHPGRKPGQLELCKEMHKYTDEVRQVNGGDPRALFEAVGINLPFHQAEPAPSRSGADEFYRLRSIKRDRRTKAQISAIKAAITEILTESHPQTVRQVFYALTVRGAVGKLESEYHQTVIRLLTEMRETEAIPFEWIADNTRWMRKPSSFTGLDQCLDITATSYRRNQWAVSPIYVEVWCEKDALAGVLLEETRVYDVPLMVAKGYASISFLHSAAKAIEGRGKPAHIYHFGDLDPSGQDAARDIEAKLKRYAPEAEIHFERVAVTRRQVEQWNLPTRPTKMTHTRAKKFIATSGATSVELDAIPAAQLRQLAKECIEHHVDKHHLGILRITEASERELLTRLAAPHRGSEAPR
jgi:hypothetical protein